MISLVSVVQGEGWGCIRTSKLVDLHGTQHRNIDAASTDHAKAFMAAECGGTLDEGNGLLSGIDEIRIPLTC